MNNAEFAGFWVRFVATLLDAIFFLVVFAIPVWVIYGDIYWTSDEWVLGFWDVVWGNVAPILVTIWFWIRYFGTPGKMVLKLKIVDAASGNRVTIGQAIIRYLSYIPAILFLGLGLFWVAFDKKKQGWHDKLARTVVVMGEG